MRANPLIIGFLSGERPDSKGRHLQDILRWPDDRLESVHDFIQWLFPLTEPSPVDPDAPVLDSATIAEIRSTPALQQAVRTSWLRMLDFYGLEARGDRVEKASEFEAKSRNWLRAGNHNHLRITRILKCLRLCGLEREASAFFDCLADIYERDGEERVTKTTFRFWKEAVS